MFLDKLAYWWTSHLHPILLPESESPSWSDPCRACKRFRFLGISSDCLGRSVFAHRIQLWRNELYVESHSYLLRNALTHRHEGSSPQTIALVTIGGVLLILAGVQEAYTKKKSAIIPARLFKTRTTSIILIVIFFHALAFFAGRYHPRHSRPWIQS